MLPKFTLPIYPVAKMLAVSAIFLSSSNLFAQSGEAPNSGWSTEIGISLGERTGNSDISSADVFLELAHNKDFNERNPYRHVIEGSYAFSDVEVSPGNRMDTRNEKYLGYSLDYLLDEKSYVSGVANYYSNSLAGVDELYLLGAEYRRILFESARHQLSAMAGLAQVDVRYTDESDIDQFGFMAGVDYALKLTDTLTFKQTAETREIEDLSYRVSYTALEYALNQSTSIALTHDIVYFSRVPEFREKKDTSTSLMLNFNF